MPIPKPIDVVRHIAVLTSIVFAILVSTSYGQLVVAQSSAPQNALNRTDAVSFAAANSIGKLWVPGVRYKDGHAQNYTEQCSATLITTDARQVTSRFLISAWHCIEDYQDLSKTIYFESSNGSRHKSHIVASGGGMHSDWALLRLSDSLSPVVVLTDQKSVIGSPLEMAGFPRRDGTTNTSPDSWDLKVENCHATGRDASDWSTDCVLTKGASGGAVLDSTGRYLGVISRGDGATQSIFVANDRFRTAINRFLY